MPLVLDSRRIERVRIVDDDPRVRAAYGDPVEELELQPILVEGPLRDLDQFISDTLGGAEAAILDHRLRVGNYANFDGAESVARLYQHQFPAVMCTTYGIARSDEIRRYRRHIPIILRPDELDPDSLAHGFERCVEEFNGVFRPSRRPWRALVSVEDIGEDEWSQYFFVVIPGWDPKDKIRLGQQDVPGEIRAMIQPGALFHTQVNLGAENQEDLYFDFDRWEVD